MRLLSLTILSFICSIATAQSDFAGSSFSHDLKSFNGKTYDYEVATHVTEDIQILFVYSESAVVVMHFETKTAEEHHIILQTNENGNDIIFTSYLGVEYKWVFPITKSLNQVSVYSIQENKVYQKEITYYY